MQGDSKRGCARLAGLVLGVSLAGSLAGCGVVERVMARKPAADHPPLPTPDYAFPAIPRAAADRAGADDFHRFLDRVAEDSAQGDHSVLESWREGN